MTVGRSEKNGTKTTYMHVHHRFPPHSAAHMHSCYDPGIRRLLF